MTALTVNPIYNGHTSIGYYRASIRATWIPPVFAIYCGQRLPVLGKSELWAIKKKKKKKGEKETK
jgi:hypothetical protein